MSNPGEGGGSDDPGGKEKLPKEYDSVQSAAWLHG
jgi:hypothetical protein